MSLFTNQEQILSTLRLKDLDFLINVLFLVIKYKVCAH